MFVNIFNGVFMWHPFNKRGFLLHLVQAGLAKTLSVKGRKEREREDGGKAEDFNFFLYLLFWLLVSHMEFFYKRNISVTKNKVKIYTHSKRLWCCFT